MNQIMTVQNIVGIPLTVNVTSSATGMKGSKEAIMQPIRTPLLKGRAVILRIEDKLPLLLLVKTVTFLSCLTVSVSIACATAQTNTLPVPLQEKLAVVWRRADVDLGGSVIMPIYTCNIYML